MNCDDSSDGAMFFTPSLEVCHMVEILCPHCEEEIELDDDAYGEFSCPYCDGEFEWGEKPKANATSNSEPMNGIKAASHALHGAGGIMLIIGMFTGWLTVGGILDASPFGMKASVYGFSASVSWFELFGDGGDPVLAIFGIIFMLLAIVAIVSQITHIVFRVVNHLSDIGKLEVSMQMAYRSYQYRWHTSLTALASSVAGVVVMEIGFLIGFGGELASGFPRPSVFGILLLITLGGQFVMMNQELANE
ncbi:MAG: hypothetical protein CMB28_00330 [Euryarchaeota archaeon]|nr:hypothetical protein [Euryarchaeota archaeon]